MTPAASRVEDSELAQLRSEIAALRADVRFLIRIVSPVVPPRALRPADRETLAALLPVLFRHTKNEPLRAAAMRPFFSAGKNAQSIAAFLQRVEGVAIDGLQIERYCKESNYWCWRVALVDSP